MPDIAIESLLGAGGFATTWAARSDRYGEVALKISRRTTRAARQAFEAEARALENAQGSGVPRLRGQGVFEDRAYLLMERIAGRSLGTLLEDASAPLGLAEVQPLGLAIATALQELHARGLVHRDLKPDNVLVDEDEVRLIDLGLCATAGGSVSPAGTPEYAAPEQMRGACPSPAADVYALGVVLFELCTLRLPFVGDNASLEYAHANLRPPRASHFAEVPRALDELIGDCLRKDAARRPTLQEFGARLQAASQTDVVALAQRAQIRQRMQPCILLAAEILIDVVTAVQLAERHGAFVVEHEGSEILIAWLGQGASRPLERARACAAALDEMHARRLTLHLDRVLAVDVGSVPTLFGTAIDHRSDWWLEHDSGVLATASVPEQAEDDDEAELVGRASLIELALSWARETFDDERPGFFWVTGDAGTGKTRLLAELACQLAAQRPELTIVHDRAPDVDPFEGGERLLDLACEAPVLVLVDDCHKAHEAYVRSLQYATLGEEPAPICVIATAPPEHRKVLDAWVARAARSAGATLEPLSPAESTQLLRQLLAPVQYPPEDALDRLSQWARGNPALLIDLVRALRRNGYIVRRGERAQLDTERLAELPDLPVASWLADGLLSSLPPEMAELMQLCSLLAQPFTIDDVEVVIAALETTLEVSFPVAEIGVFSLVQAGHLLESERSYHFDDMGLRAALAAGVEAGYARRVHDVALERWRTRVVDSGGDPVALAALAHHAAGAGDEATRMLADLDLGREALRCHRPVEAESHFASVLALREPRAEDRVSLLARKGLGMAQYRIDKALAAADNLRRAAALAARLGDVREQILCLLEAATALDWAQDFGESARVTTLAENLVDGDPDASLALRLALARGRCAWRQERIGDAIELLTDAAESSAALRDYDTRVIALMLLGPALVLAGRIDDAERRFEELIALCEPANDRLHLCAAYGNRMFLWSARKQPERARDDLRIAMRLAKQVGHPGPERVATYNLAEDLYWSGEADDEAFELARRARSLAERFIEVPVAEDALLLARTALAVGELDVARAQLAWIRATFAEGELSAAGRSFATMLEASLDGLDDDPRWADLLASSAELGGDDLLEILYWWGRWGLDHRRRDASAALREADAMLERFPIWRARFDDLREDLGE